jgi:PilZ domain
MKQSRRISPRVPYDEAITLARCDGPGRLHTRGIDLSATGVSVVSAESYPVGTAVRCTLLLAGGPRTVEGRLVRVTALSRGLGLAVAFTSMDAGAAASIRRLIGARTREVLPAKVRLDGVDRPLRCEARLDQGRVRLTATLPFLRLDGGADVIIGGDGETDGDGARLAPGVISKIALDPSAADGVPRLSFDVALSGGAPRPARTPILGLSAVGAPEPWTAAPPSDLPPPCSRALPSVMVSPGLARDVRKLEERPPRRKVHGTAEVARRPEAALDWAAWTAPPPVARLTERVNVRRRGWRAWLGRLIPSLRSPVP